LGLSVNFEVDAKMYTEKSEWMMLKLHSSEPDFFDNAVGGYSSQEEEINMNNFKF
jgi:hypothetical protein